MFKAAIRVNKLKSVAQLRGASLHAARHDEIGRARVREGADPGEALAWAKGGNDRDYLAAFRAHKAELGAGERKGAPLAMQVLCVVSPEWVQQAGNLHDRDNPRNRTLFEQAKAWAESWAGKGAVFGVRLDLDEKGGAVVDLLLAPLRESRGKPVISTQKPLVELKAATGERNEYAALQTSWAEWCQQHLDQNITRGLRRELTGREHLSPETYGQVMDKARMAVQRPAESLREALQAADLSEREIGTLQGYLALRSEMERHRRDPRGYEPPMGEFHASHIQEQACGAHDPWPLIHKVRGKAEQIIETAHRFGFSLDALRRPDGHEKGREWFPNLADRLHLTAAIAKCAAFCGQIEARVKNTIAELTGRSLDLEPRQCWPRDGAELVARYNRHLGLDLPQPVATVPEHQTRPVERVREAAERPAKPQAVRPAPEREATRTRAPVSRDDDHGFDL